MSKHKQPLFENARARLQASAGDDAQHAARPSLIPGKGSEKSPQQPKPDRLQATLTNLYKKCIGKPASFMVHQREVQLAVAPFRKISLRTRAAAKLFLDGEFLWVLLEDWPFPDKSGGQFDREGFYTLPRDLRNRILMLQIGGFIHLLNRQAGIQIQVISDEHPDRIQDSGLLEMELSSVTSRQDRARAKLLYPIRLLPKLKQLIDEFWPDSALSSDVEKYDDGAVKLCNLALTVGKLRRLQPGDFIHGSKDCLLGGAPVLCFKGKPVAYLKKAYENQFLVLESAEADPEKPELNGYEAPESPDELLVDLSIYLSQKALSQEEARILNPGEIVNLAIPLDETVVIKVGEQLLGKGEIFGVGLDTAIQITEIFGRS